MYKVAAAQQVFGRAAAEALNALKVIAFAKR
jgi:hypothetical protein